MEYVESVQALIPGIDIRGNVTQRVTDMEARTGGVGKHVEYIEFGFGGINGDLESLVGFPVRLPSGFNFPEVVFHNDEDN
jgi:hypothetical protein